MGKMPKIHLHPAHNRDSALAAGAKRRDEGRVATVVDEGGRRRSSVGRQMLCKVPEVTFYFWVIKVLCTTVGEAFSDLINETVGLGLAKTAAIFGAALLVALVAQFAVKRYIVPIYWVNVVLISVEGTLATDAMTDGAGIPLWVSTLSFGLALIAVFVLWWVVERTLSVHTIYTTRRELFYWLTIFVTFALGTAVGDLTAEKSGMGFGWSVLLWGGIIALIYLLYRFARAPAVLSFWCAYVLTRPLGASIGDLLSADKSEGGLGAGTLVTSLLFLGLILITAGFLFFSKVDVARERSAPGLIDSDEPPQQLALHTTSGAHRNADPLNQV